MNSSKKEICHVAIFIAKGLIARFIFLSFNTVSVWRTIISLQSEYFLALLWTMLPQIIETYIAISIDHLRQRKWINPSSLCFLLCAIPNIWLLEIKLLSDRTGSNLFPWIVYPNSSVSMGNNTDNSTFSLEDDVIAVEANWVISLEQMIIFCLVVAKWIAPKGDLTDSEFSELLLIYIASGADIIELLEILEDPDAQSSYAIVGMVLGVWSWSLFQFAVELTATKKFPVVDEDVLPFEEYFAKPTQPTTSPSTYKPVPPAYRSLSAHSKEPVKLETVNERGENEDKGLKRNEKKIAHLQELMANKYSCYNFFCFYNETWGLSLGLLLQDFPYFIVRIFVIVQYGIITQLNLFFLCKNLFLMVLHANRIRVIYNDDLSNWKEYRERVLAYKPLADQHRVVE